MKRWEVEWVQPRTDRWTTPLLLLFALAIVGGTVVGLLLR